jgi:hypothetical protein
MFQHPKVSSYHESWNQKDPVPLALELPGHGRQGHADGKIPFGVPVVILPYKEAW